MIVLAVLSLAATGCGNPQPKVTLELFLVSPAEDKTVAYGRFSADLSRDSADPDTVARSLASTTATRRYCIRPAGGGKRTGPLC